MKKLLGLLLLIVSAFSVLGQQVGTTGAVMVTNATGVLIPSSSNFFTANAALLTAATGTNNFVNTVDNRGQTNTGQSSFTQLVSSSTWPTNIFTNNTLMILSGTNGQKILSGPAGCFGVQPGAPNGIGIGWSVSVSNNQYLFTGPVPGNANAMYLTAPLQATYVNTTNWQISPNAINLRDDNGNQEGAIDGGGNGWFPIWQNNGLVLLTANHTNSFILNEGFRLGQNTLSFDSLTHPNSQPGFSIAEGAPSDSMILQSNGFLHLAYGVTNAFGGPLVYTGASQITGIESSSTWPTNTFTSTFTFSGTNGQKILSGPAGCFGVQPGAPNGIGLGWSVEFGSAQYLFLEPVPGNANAMYLTAPLQSTYVNQSGGVMSPNAINLRDDNGNQTGAIDGGGNGWFPIWQNNGLVLLTANPTNSFILNEGFRLGQNTLSFDSLTHPNSQPGFSIAEGAPSDSMILQSNGTLHLAYGVTNAFGSSVAVLQPLTVAGSVTSTAGQFNGNGAGLTNLMGNSQQYTNGIIFVNGTNCFPNLSGGNPTVNLTGDCCIVDLTNGPGEISLTFTAAANYNVLFPSAFHLQGNTNIISAVKGTNDEIVLTNGYVLTLVVRPLQVTSNPSASNSIIFMGESGN